MRWSGLLDKWRARLQEQKHRNVLSSLCAVIYEICNHTYERNYDPRVYNSLVRTFIRSPMSLFHLVSLWTCDIPYNVPRISLPTILMCSAVESYVLLAFLHAPLPQFSPTKKPYHSTRWELVLSSPYLIPGRSSFPSNFRISHVPPKVYVGSSVNHRV